MRIDVINGKVNNLEKIQEKFDYIFIPHSLEQIRDTKELLGSLKKFLKDSGEIIIVTYNIIFVSVLTGLLQNIWDSSPAGIQKEKNISFFSIETLNMMFKECGYKNIGIEKIEDNVSYYEKIYKNILPLFSKFVNLDEYIINSIVTSFVAIYK